MDALGSNPLGILTFIVAPAILTNASSVMALGTANRFARAIDRARELSAQVEGKELDPDPEIALRLRQLTSAERRALLLVRALTAFYLSVGCFAAASLVSLLGAVLFVTGHELLHRPILVAAFCAGTAGCSLSDRARLSKAARKPPSPTNRKPVPSRANSAFQAGHKPARGRCPLTSPRRELARRSIAPQSCRTRSVNVG